MEPRPYLVAVECPRSELHVAALLVEREVLDVDGAGTLVDRRRLPANAAVREQRRLRHQRHLVAPVRADTTAATSVRVSAEQ